MAALTRLPQGGEPLTRTAGAFARNFSTFGRAPPDLRKRRQTGAPVRGTGGVRTGASWCPPRRNVVDMDHPTATTRWSPQLVRDLTAADVSPASAARELAAHGIPVFPCAPGQKRPLTAHGFHDASSNPGNVSRWWSLWPTANLGIPTGSISGIDVVDVDVHAAGSGFDSFQKAQRAGIVSNWAWQVRTPSGGLHAYFLRWHDHEQRSWQLPGHHLDFRGDGGYVGVRVAVVQDRALAPPAGLIEHLSTYDGWALVTSPAGRAGALPARSRCRGLAPR